MAFSHEYAAYVSELLASLGPIRIKRMFGGAGVYCEGVMMALVADEQLYLKTDDVNRPAFEAAGCEAFIYSGKRGQTKMSYYRAPDDAMESPALMLPWARSALAAALRARKQPPRQPRTRVSTRISTEG